jgi:hypothetical protein
LEANTTGSPADGVIRYQWRLNGVAIRGAMRPKFEIPLVSLVHAGSYDVVVSNNYERVVSSPCAVQVAETTRIVTQPPSLTTVNPGESVRLAVVLNNTDGVTYQWIHGIGRASTVLAGQTASTLVIQSAKASDAGVYMLIMTTPSGRISSSLARVNVNLPVVITQNPSSTPVLKPGDSVTLSVKATGTGPLAYQWLRNDAPIAGASGSTFTIAAVSAADAADYRVAITNVVSTSPVLSGVATVSVLSPPVITKQPADLKLDQWAAKTVSGANAPLTSEESQRQNASLELTVETAQDLPPNAQLTYQWRKNGMPITGGTLATLKRDFLSVYDTGLYDVEVTEKLGSLLVGSTVSRQAVVVVHERPVFTVPPASLVVAPGGTASFGALAAGTPPLLYAWRKGGSASVLMSSSTLQLRGVDLPDAGSYTLTVTGPTGKTATATVELTVGGSAAGSAFSQQPLSVVGIQDAEVSLLAAPREGYSIVRWERIVNSGTSLVPGVVPEAGSTDIQLLDGGSLRFVSPGSLDSGVYRAVAAPMTVTGPEVFSNWASLFINLKDPLYNGALVDKTKREEVFNQVAISAAENGSATFRMFPVGEGLSYEWSKGDGRADLSFAAVEGLAGEKPLPNSVPLPNSNRTAFTLRNLKKSDEGLYFGTVNIPNGSDGFVSRYTVVYRLIVQPLPVIGKNPVDIVRIPGETAVFSIQADVTPDTRFQWFFQRAATSEWVPVPGAAAGSANASTCSVSNVQEGDEGSYRVEVTNGAGTVSSASAYLMVRNPVQVRLISDPVAASSGTVSVNPYSRLTLSADVGNAAAAGDLFGDEQNPPTYTFKVRRKGRTMYETIQAGTSSVLTSDKVREVDEGFFTVTVEGKVNGQVTSAPLRVSVNDPVSLVPSSVKILSLLKGESVTLKAEAKGYEPQYDWYFKGVSSTGWTQLAGTSATYTILNAGSSNAGSYGVVARNTVQNESGQPVTDPANGIPREVARVSVNVNTPPVVTILDAVNPLQVGEGGSLALTAQVDGSSGGLIQFQWRRDGVAADGPLASGSMVLVSPLVTFAKPNASLRDAGQYELIVSNANGWALSAKPRLVQVTPAPSITLVSRPQNAAASANGTATFRVTATATGPISYQWQRLQGGLDATVESNWVNVGTDAPVYSVRNLAAAEDSTVLGDDRSRYRVVLSIPGADFALPEKPEAELRVSKPTDVRIAQQPFLVTGGSVLSVGSGSLQLKAVALELAGGKTLSYQWRKDGVAIIDNRSKTTGKASGSVERGSDDGFVITYDLPKIENDSDGVYDLLVDNGANFASSEALALSVNPKILSLDVPALVNPGDSAKLEVKVPGSGYTFQWRRTGTNLVDSGSISGATTSVLRLSAVTEAQSGTYSVVVTNAGVSTVSAGLPLTVAAKVAIPDAGQPSFAGELKTGNPLTLRVQATGGGVVTYQWFKDGRALESGTSATLSVPSVTLQHAGLYQVRVSNAGSSVMSNLVTVRVAEPLSVNLHTPLSVDLGQSANLVPTITGSGTLSYQWLRNGAELPSATSEQYRISPATAADDGTYRLRVTSKQADGSTESAISNGLVLSVKLLPQIIVPPASLTLGGSVNTASFAVVVRSKYPVTYAWTRDGDPVGGNSPYLNLTGVTASSEVKVTVSNPEGAVSATARLTVGATAPKVQNAGSFDASQVYSYASWWVFWVQATGGTQAGDYGDYQAGSTKGGYWLMQRINQGTVLEPVVIPGQSLWVWGDSLAPSDPAAFETWDKEEQTVQDALDSENSEFSVHASRAASNYALSGRVEPSGEASLYGAPAVMEGAYQNAAFGRLDINLVWDGEQVLYFDGNTNLEAIKTQLQSVLSVELAKIKGE